MQRKTYSKKRVGRSHYGNSFDDWLSDFVFTVILWWNSGANGFMFPGISSVFRHKFTFDSFTVHLFDAD